MMQALVALVVAVAAVPAVGADKAEGVTTLGRVSIDKQEAIVTLQGPTAGKDRFIVTVEVIRPKGSPPIKTSRLKVWMLRQNFDAIRPVLVLEDSPEGEFLPERQEKEGVVAYASFSFDAEGHQRQHLAAAVVAVDGEPVAFKIATPAK
jgi:hypothetical protein